MTAPTFGLVTAPTVRDLLAGHERDLVALVGDAYRALAAGRAVNPPSSFLRFRDRPDDRIIALPAALENGVRAGGLKWISSVPGNRRRRLPRASAVLVLNDGTTGFPVACLEGSLISAARTAASAALAAGALCGDRPRPAVVGYLGAGNIARHVHGYLRAAGWRFDEVLSYDTDPAAAEAFAGALRRDGGRAVAVPTAEQAVTGAGLVVFATTAGRPYLTDPALFAHAPVVLHLSLRDLAPAVLLAADNVVDDVDHCLRERTSAHLTEQQTGSRDFVTGTLVDVLAGRVAPTGRRTVIFSPFGLGVLDLAVGWYVYQRAVAEGALTEVPDFFAGLAT
jgi:2,3-diaminopropionate biosynthesis protein SbnB